MKRVFLLIATNIAVMVVLSIVVSVLGLDQYLTANGIDYFSLLWLSAIFGFGGAFISLLMSKWIAKMSVGAQTIDGSEGTTQYWLGQTVHKLADAAHIGRPEVAIYEGPANAVATGAPRDAALGPVSSGVVQRMSKDGAAGGPEELPASTGARAPLVCPPAPRRSRCASPRCKPGAKLFR